LIHVKFFRGDLLTLLSNSILMNVRSRYQAHHTSKGIRKEEGLMDEPIELKSARLTIREVAPDDLPLLLPVYLSNPEYVAQSEGSQGEAGYFDLEMFQRDWRIAQMTPGRHMLGVYLKETSEAVGLADYVEENPEDGQPWLGFLMIARAHQRQGLGTEVFTCLVEYFRNYYGWPSLRVGVMKTNTGALAFWRRLGFQETPTDAAAVRKRYVTLQRAL
jgi:RimJ/RimL family protein N-acetyltransferase